MINRIDLMIADINTLLAARADRKAARLLDRLDLRWRRDEPTKLALDVVKRLRLLERAG